jgi:RHS repeat-associated protein
VNLSSVTKLLPPLLSFLLVFASSPVMAAETPADIYKKILPALEYLLEEDPRIVWTLTPPVAASYEVFARWVVKPGNSNAAFYTVYHASGSANVTRNQQVNGGQWVSLGTFNLAPGQDHRVELKYTGTGGVIADAVRIHSPTLVQGTIVHNVFSDHLDTPRLVATAGDNPQTLWTWNNDDPFGANAPATPAGPYTFNLRFPGQYFDSETNLHYNYFRDFDRLAGRYVQSDPLGVAGGENPYTYATNNPLTNIDPMGLIAKPISSMNEQLPGRGNACGATERDRDSAFDLAFQPCVLVQTISSRSSRLIGCVYSCFGYAARITHVSHSGLCPPSPPGLRPY